MKKITLSLIAVLTFSCAAIAQKTKIVLETEYGKMVLSLYDRTPKHRDNMIMLVKKHFYDSLLFHRVIPQFMIQGGDPESKNAQSGAMLGNGDIGYVIPAEFDSMYFHKKGALAAARTANPEKASSGCQFYIVTGKTYTDKELDNAEIRSQHKIPQAQREIYKTVGGTPQLDANYTVFGEVIEGMDIPEKIAAVQRNQTDRPDKDVRILKMYVQKKKKHFLFF